MTTTTTPHFTTLCNHYLLNENHCQMRTPLIYISGIKKPLFRAAEVSRLSGLDAGDEFLNFIVRISCVVRFLYELRV